jgi:hypothetical protein
MEVPNAKVTFSKIRQRGAGWCIPACFESLARYANLRLPTQEEIVWEYHRRYGNCGYIDPAKKCLCTLANPTIEDLKNYAFPKGGFVEFTEIANSLLPADSGKTFFHPTDSDAKFESYVCDSASRGDGLILVLCPKDEHCHALVLVGQDKGILNVYDPQHGDFHDVPAKAFNKDCVILKSLPVAAPFAAVG